jgi:ankyrin repeat protein
MKFFKKNLFILAGLLVNLAFIIIQVPINSCPIDYEKLPGITGLHRAAFSGDVAKAKKLIEAGIDINARDTFEKITPLCLAAMQGHLAIVQLLLSHGAQINLGNWERVNALHFACGLVENETRIEIVRQLLAHGATVDWATKYDQTPLNRAARSGNMRVAKILLDAGAAVEGCHENTESGYFGTPLQAAIYTQNMDLVKLFLARGAQVAVKKFIPSPLHIASHYRGYRSNSTNAQIAQLLIDHHANVNALDSFSFTPLHIAAQTGNSAVVKILLAEGSDTTLKSSLTAPDGFENKTALEVAQKKLKQERKYKKNDPLYSNPVGDDIIQRLEHVINLLKK